MDKPPNRFILYLVLLAVALVIAWVGLRLAFAQTPHTEATVSLESCSYHQPNIPYVPKYQVLGTVVDKCFYKIIEGESRFDPTICNQKYGCGSGIGLGQLTAVAIADCEKGIGRQIDPYNPHDNLECSLWLYEKYGTAPWGTEDTEWGSWNYWQNHCK